MIKNIKLSPTLKPEFEKEKNNTYKYPYNLCYRLIIKQIFLIKLLLEAPVLPYKKLLIRLL